MRNKRILLPAIVILGLSIAVATVFLSNNDADDYDWMMRISANGSGNYSVQTTYDEGKVGESFGIGLYDAPIHTADHSLHHSVALHANESLAGYFWVSNQMTTENDYLIFLLSDYEQVPFFFGEDRVRGVLHPVSLEPFEERFFRFETDPLSCGVHDLEIVLVMKPYEHSLETSFRRSTDFSYLGSKRLNAFVDSTEFPVVSYANASVLKSRSCGSDYPVNDGLLITRDPCSTAGWFTENVTAGDRLDYWINAAADDNYPVTFALIPLVDFVQVPVKMNDPVDALFCSLEAGEKISIPASIIVPEEEGVHELMVLWVPAPHRQLEGADRVSLDLGQWPWTEPSIRVGLVTGGAG